MKNDTSSIHVWGSESPDNAVQTGVKLQLGLSTKEEKKLISPPPEKRPITTKLREKLPLMGREQNFCAMTQRPLEIGPVNWVG